jgi:hypothetical protein
MIDLRVDESQTQSASGAGLRVRRRREIIGSLPR